MHDKERTMAQMRHLAEEAREARSANSPQRDESNLVGVVAPIHMGTSPVIPERYVVHYSITTCANCRHESRDNEFYALSYLKSRINGSRVKHLTRCERPEWNLPVEVIPTRALRVPFCCECEVIDLSHLPPPPSAGNLYDLAEPQYKGVKPRQPKADIKKPSSTKPSLDDLA